MPGRAAQIRRALALDNEEAMERLLREVGMNLGLIEPSQLEREVERWGGGRPIGSGKR